MGILRKRKQIHRRKNSPFTATDEMIIEELFQEYPLPKATQKETTKSKKQESQREQKETKEQINQLKKQRSPNQKKPFLYTNDLTDFIITNEKIANQAVDKSKIKKGSITTEHLENESVITEKI